MANYVTALEVVQTKRLTAAAAKDFSDDQDTAIEKLITMVHGMIIEIAGEELASTEGLKLIENQAVQRWIWNQENPEKDPKDIFTDKMIEGIVSAKLRSSTAEDEIYAKETH